MSYRVAVRALCEFGARTGDLDLRFTPAPSALEGIAGHQQVAAGRGPDYQSEVPLEGQYGQLLVRGRADGFDAARQCLEEVKTHRGDLARQAPNVRALHWAQAQVYGWLLCQQQGLAELVVALVYLDVDSGKQTRFEERHSAQALQQVFQRLCQHYVHWARQEQARRAARDDGLRQLTFPLATWRPGQRELAETVFKAASTGRCLLAQAPTGIGKTLGTLFPALKAMAPQQLDVLMFLTAKTPGRRLALDALARLRSPAVPLRVLELVARDKACEYPGTACHGEACPLARGFYDRLPAARAQAAEAGWLDRQALREVALRHQVCPYYLAQEMAHWADVIVGDYNYWFDVSAWLHGLAQQQGWRTTLLVDEAHNLVDRARSMYSAELDQHRLAPLRKAPLPGLAGPLQRLTKAWNALNAEQAAPYQAATTPPAAWLAALQGCIGALNICLNENPQGLQGPWLQFYFDALHVQRIAERFGERFGDGHVFDSHLYSLGRQRRSRLCLRNLIPAQALAPRMQAAHSAVLFSATLSPARYFLDLLGLPADCAWLDVPSPFAARQLQVRLARHVSTRYQHRESSLAALAQVLAGQYRRQPGNYLAFFSSYQYLEQALAALRAEAPGVPVWAQAPRMGEAEREAFVERFVEGGKGIGFAVLGGAFGEGIDLPGGRLIGAFVATLGLAQLNPVNEQLRQCLQQRYGAGYDYAYLYPGLHKVVQAAGRVIRDERDQGVVVLIDDRFAQPQVQALLPRWWPLAEPCPPALPGAYGHTLSLLG